MTGHGGGCRMTDPLSPAGSDDGAAATWQSSGEASSGSAAKPTEEQ